MKKKIKLSTQKERQVKEETRSERAYTYLDTYTDLRTLKQTPVSEAFLERLGKEFVEWALIKENEEVMDKRKICIQDFFAYKGINKASIYRWMEKSPSFKEQYLFGRNLIGLRREKGAFWKEASEKIFLRNAHQYEDDWKDADVFHSKLAKEEAPQEEILLKVESYKIDDKGTETPV